MNEQRFIDVNELIESTINFCNNYEVNWTDQKVIAWINNASTANVVSKSLFDQYKWERDIAIEQLAELGLGLGQKIDGVYLSKEEYEDMLEYMGQRP